ncbi:MAG: hypothetical protein RR005_07775 [Mucinivorans sp.]
MKSIKRLLLIILLAPIISAQSQSIKWSPFIWQSDTISGRYIEKAYLYVPLKIENIPYEFTMQLDLGTPNSLFYGEVLKPYLEKHPAMNSKLGDYEDMKGVIFKDVNLKMGTADFKANLFNMFMGNKVPANLFNSPTPVNIGTIAADAFKEKVLIIDYKANRFAVAESVPKEYQKIPAVNFEINKDGLIFLSFNINGEDCKVMFDTGSSIFELVTTTDRALKIADSTIVDSLSGALWWGQQITFYGLKVDKTVKIGGKTMKCSRVYYDKDRKWDVGVFEPLNIWGLTGNAFFFDNTVIIDYKNKEFRVK